MDLCRGGSIVPHYTPLETKQRDHRRSSHSCFKLCSSLTCVARYLSLCLSHGLPSCLSPSYAICSPACCRMAAAAPCGVAIFTCGKTAMAALPRTAASAAALMTTLVGQTMLSTVWIRVRVGVRVRVAWLLGEEKKEMLHRLFCDKYAWSMLNSEQPYMLSYYYKPSHAITSPSHAITRNRNITGYRKARNAITGGTRTDPRLFAITFLCSKENSSSPLFSLLPCRSLGQRSPRLPALIASQRHGVSSSPSLIVPILQPMVTLRGVAHVCVQRPETTAQLPERESAMLEVFPRNYLSVSLPIEATSHTHLPRQMISVSSHCIVSPLCSSI